ncbi:MAG: DinB family protein [Anaerolineales bacterium]|jgi:hypothetical protein|nr:DinB family protein [Anaerolineales bacterium]MDX9935607.1 DinB family protein [Anaerolineales bacterium]GER78472.1 conserved hypothetical protein [Candidatus Denitrolinea symbiosum]
MEQLLEYRQKLLDRYEAAAREFREAVEAAPQPDIPREAGGWNVRQIAAHTRDVEKFVYGARVRRTLEEDDPLFENFDGETYMTEHYRADEPLASILDELAASVRDNAARLRTLPPEAWTRPGRHATYGGGFTIQAWVERALAHIEEHLKTVQG